MGRVETGTSSGRENAFKEGGETERTDRADIYLFFSFLCVFIFNCGFKKSIGIKYI